MTVQDFGYPLAHEMGTLAYMSQNKCPDCKKRHDQNPSILLWSNPQLQDKISSSFIVSFQEMEQDRKSLLKVSDKIRKDKKERERNPAHQLIVQEMNHYLKDCERNCMFCYRDRMFKRDFYVE